MIEFSLSKVMRMLLFGFIYLLVRVTGLSKLVSSLFSHELVLYPIPFRYIFLYRFGECYVVDSAFSRRYYDGFKLGKGMIVVDIGAHIGTFTIRVAKRVGKGGLVIAM